MNNKSPIAELQAFLSRRIENYEKARSGGISRCPMEESLIENVRHRIEEIISMEVLKQLEIIARRNRRN
jgi:hypothetical protein